MKSQATKAASQIRQTKSWRRWRSRSTTCRRPTRSGDLFGGMLGATSGVLSVGGNIAPVHEADGAADASTCKAAAVTASGMGAGASISRGAKATANAEACMSFTQVRRPRTVCLWMRAERERVPKLGNGVSLLTVFLSNRTRRRDGGTRNYRLGFDCAGRAGDRGLLSSFADRPRWAHSPGPSSKLARRWAHSPGPSSKLARSASGPRKRESPRHEYRYSFFHRPNTPGPSVHFSK